MHSARVSEPLVTTKNLDVVCITETWLTASTKDNELAPHKFNIYRCDRDTRGGGILIAICKKIPSRAILISHEVELLVIEVFISPKLLIGCVYIPPSCPDNYLSNIDSAIRNLNLANDFILCGDYNCPDVDWLTMSATSSTSMHLCAISFEYNLVQLVRNPTHSQGNCLDLILTNCPDRFSEVDVDTTSFMSTSDHFVVYAEIKTHNHEKDESDVGYCFNYAKADFEEVESYLLDEDFSPVYASGDIDSIWLKLKSIITNVCSQVVPTFNKKSRYYPRWFTAEVKHLLNCVHTLRKRLKSSRSVNLAIRLENLERKLGEACTVARSNYVAHLINNFSSAPSKLYRFISDLSKPSHVLDYL